MTAHHRVEKSGPTLATNSQPTGVQFTPSEATQQALSEIAAQMQQPHIDEIIGEAPSAKDDEVLDDAFIKMTTPPSIKIASVAVRKQVEASLKPMDPATLFLQGELRQEVRVLSGLKVTFKTLTSQEDLYIKRKLNESKSDVMRYVEDRFLIMQLAGHIYAINGEPLPTFIDVKDSDAAFEQRFNHVAKLPVSVVERTWVHWVWFQRRVEDLLDKDFLTIG
jgi:hypothetical protein